MTSQAPWGTVLGPGVVMALALMGHELLAVVLPVHAAAFGLSLVWVGVLLSANRFIRVIGYGWIAALGRHVGPKTLCVLAAFTATLTTLAYGLVDGGPLLLAARLVWGLTFAALNLASLAYAMAVLANAGMRVGVNRSISSLGPTLALSLGSLAVVWLGPRDIFVALGLVTALAIPIALTLPRVTVANQVEGSLWLTKPDDISVFYFTVGLTIDGLFVMTLALLFADDVSLDMAVLSTGLLLALRYLAGILFGPMGGWLGDRIGPVRAQLLFGVATVVGLAAIAADFVTGGALVIVICRAMLSAVGPVAVARRYGVGDMTAISRQAAWTDLGGAIGPLVVGAALQVMHVATLPQLYWVAAAITAVALANLMRLGPGLPEPIPARVEPQR